MPEPASMLERRPRRTIPMLEAATMTLTEAVQKTLQNLMEVQKRSPRTLTNYRRTMSQYLGHVIRDRGLPDDIHSFSRDTVKSFVDELGTYTIGNTILNKLHGLAALRKWCKGRVDGRSRPYLSENPLDIDELPRATSPAVKFLLPAEFDKFLRCIVPPEVDLARALVVDTMIRRLEACEAVVGDLQQVGDNVCLMLAVKGRRTPGEGKVKIDLSAAFAERLIAYLKERRAEAHEPLILNRQGKAWTEAQMTGAFVRIGDKAGVKRLTTSPHTIRHTVA